MKEKIVFFLILYVQNLWLTDFLIVDRYLNSVNYRGKKERKKKSLTKLNRFGLIYETKQESKMTVKIKFD